LFSRSGAALLATVVIWTTPALFQFYLAEYFDVWTQNFYRYAAGFLIILPLGYLQSGKDGPTLAGKDWVRGVLCSLTNSVHQITQTAAVILMLPGLYAVFGRLSVLITALLAALFFVEERWTLQSRLFRISLLLGLVGAAGVSLLRPGASLATDWLGVGLGLVAAFSWGLYAIQIKGLTEKLGAARSFSIIGFCTTLVLFVGMISFGDAMAVTRAPWQANVLLFGSGALCIGIGHVLYYVSIRDLGASFSQSIQLVCPFGTVLLSGWLFGEPFSLWQWLLGGVLLSGTLLAILARERAMKGFNPA
jgi:drug/metabolite transporter (DMT)-like permease